MYPAASSRWIHFDIHNPTQAASAFCLCRNLWYNEVAKCVAVLPHFLCSKRTIFCRYNGFQPLLGYIKIEVTIQKLIYAACGGEGGETRGTPDPGRGLRPLHPL